MKHYFALFAALLLAGCTKEGDTICVPDPNEEQASGAPLVTVIYGDNSLGDRSYCDMIYEGVERTALELVKKVHNNIIMYKKDSFFINFLNFLLLCVN